MLSAFTSNADTGVDDPRALEGPSGRVLDQRLAALALCVGQTCRHDRSAKLRFMLSVVQLFWFAIRRSFNRALRRKSRAAGRDRQS